MTGHCWAAPSSEVLVTVQEPPLHLAHVTRANVPSEVTVGCSRTISGLSCPGCTFHRFPSSVQSGEKTEWLAPERGLSSGSEGTAGLSKHKACAGIDGGGQHSRCGRKLPQLPCHQRPALQVLPLKLPVSGSLLCHCRGRCPAGGSASGLWGSVHALSPHEPPRAALQNPNKRGRDLCNEMRSLTSTAQLRKPDPHLRTAC